MSPASQSMPKARHLRQLMPIESPDSHHSYGRRAPPLTSQLSYQLDTSTHLVVDSSRPGLVLSTTRLQNNWLNHDRLDLHYMQKLEVNGLMKHNLAQLHVAVGNLELAFNEKMMKRKGRPTGKTLLPTGGAVWSPLRLVVIPSLHGWCYSTLHSLRCDTDNICQTLFCVELSCLEDLVPFTSSEKSGGFPSAFGVHLTAFCSN